jgi:hypothetical protein
MFALLQHPGAEFFSIQDGPGFEHAGAWSRMRLFADTTMVTKTLASDVKFFYRRWNDHRHGIAE